MEKNYKLNELNEIVQWIWEAGKEKKVWLLHGNLGAGKTTLVTALMRFLKSMDEVSSPTFSIINEYHLSADTISNYSKVYHMDLYRLQDVGEAIDAGVENFIEEKEALCIIEWPEIAQEILPKNTLTLEILPQKEDSRTLILK